MSAGVRQAPRGPLSRGSPCTTWDSTPKMPVAVRTTAMKPKAAISCRTNRSRANASAYMSATMRDTADRLMRVYRPYRGANRRNGSWGSPARTRTTRPA